MLKEGVTVTLVTVIVLNPVMILNRYSSIVNGYTATILYIYIHVEAKMW